MSIADATVTAHQSRHGFHPCDYETLLCLKEYHILLYRAYCQYKRLATWTNKTVHRSGPRPPYVPELVTLSPTGAVTFARHGGRYGPNLYLHVLAQYSAARRPRTSPGDVTPLDLPDDWKGQLDELRKVYQPGADATSS